MKVLVLSHMYPTRRKPLVGIFVRETIKRLSRQCGIKVICPYPWIPPLGTLNALAMPAQELQDGIEVYYPKYLPLPGRIFLWIKGLWCFGFIWRAVAMIRKNFNFDIIHAFRVYPDGFAAVLLGKFLNKPVVISVHGSDINIIIRNYFIKQMIQFSLTRAKRIISVSYALKERVISLGISENKVRVISSMIDTDAFRPKHKNEAKLALNLPTGKKIVLFAGNFVTVKNPQVLINAALMMKKKGRRDVLFVLVGDGRLKSRMERQIKNFLLEEMFLLTGAKMYQEMPVWMNAADVFVLPSLAEGRPKVLIEAMSCGLAIVATRVGGIPEIIKDGQTGILVAPKNLDALVSGIEKVLDNEELKETLCENGLIFIREKESTSRKKADEIINIYKSVL